MPFPESQRVIYRKNPLGEVICQLKFPTILQIKAEVPSKFQERIRSDFPLYEAEEATIPIPRDMPKELVQLFSQFSKPLAGDDIDHRFISEDGNRIITLNPDFLALTDKDYKRWEHFRHVIEVAREALEAIYGPAFYSRVGLRYKNIIDKEKIGLSEESWHGLLKSPLIGILGAEELASDLVGIQTHSLIKIDEVPGGFVTLRHGLRETKPRETKVYTIDVDFFTEERSKGADVSKILDRFNRLTGNFFRWAITKKLHNALDPEGLPSLE